MNEYELDRLYGGNTFIKATMESSCDILSGNRTAEKIGRVCRDKKSLLRNVIQRAKIHGTWIKVESLVGKMIGNGQENDVFITIEGNSVIKLNNFGLLPESATSLVGFIHRLVSHNHLFPEDAYTIIGFSLNSSNEPCKLPTQNGIKPANFVGNKHFLRL